MSAKPPPPSARDTDDPGHGDDDDDDDDEDGGPVGGEEDDDDDDDDEEDEFIPGGDDDDFDDAVDEDDDEEDDEADGGVLEGTLSMDEKNVLFYEGKKFRFTSSKPIAWNLLDAAVKPIESIYTIEMEGPCGEVDKGNSCHKRLEVTWSVPEAETSNGKKLKSTKATGDEDDDEKDVKRPSLVYSVYGRQIDSSKGEPILEFRGTFTPSVDTQQLVCQVRTIQCEASLSAAAAEKSAVAAARVDNEDEDEGDADDEIDYEELIALHQDAGVPVNDLQKRYRGKDDSAASLPNKKGKPLPDDDDDDYGF